MCSRLLICTIMLLHVSLCSWSAWQHSPTVDEPAYLAAGISHWEFGRFDLCNVSPPLVRLVAAIPVRMAGPRYDWSSYLILPGSRVEHRVGRDFMIANGEQSFWLFTLGRWGCLPFSLLGAWVSYCWSKELFGRWSAVVALLLWCFSPNIIAHAQLLTPDIGVTAFSLATCYTFWRWSQSRTWLRALIAGGVLGLAVLAKTNAIALFPALIAGITIQAIALRQLRTGKNVAQILTAFVVSVYVINLGYGFENSFRPLGEFEFFSKTFGSEITGNRFHGTILEDIPVPLPAAFLEGIDLQRRDFENSLGIGESYFRGKWYNHGWWWYYFYVIGVKVPIGTWVLVLMGSMVIAISTSPRRIESLCYLAIPGIALFALPCSQTGIGHSLRYVLPAFPFAFVIASATMCGTVGKWHRYIAITAMTWMLASSLYIFPHSLSYFNEIAGGPRNGHFHLLDGNVDFGQDLLYIRDWVENHPGENPIYAAYWGFLPLNHMGINFREPYFEKSSSIIPGRYLISVNHLRGEFRSRRKELVQFANHTPIGLVTYAIYIFHIVPPENTIRDDRQEGRGSQ